MTSKSGRLVLRFLFLDHKSCHNHMRRESIADGALTRTGDYLKNTVKSTDRSVGTFLINLLYAYTGGKIWTLHPGHAVEEYPLNRTSAHDVTYVAFLHNTEFIAEPIISGVRVTVIYDIYRLHESRRP